MLKDFAKLILTSKALVDVLKEKIETKAIDLAMLVETFRRNTSTDIPEGKEQKRTIKEKAKEEILELINEINHRTQISELQVKGFIKDKLTELTNNALLDSTELNDIRAEIASLRAEIADIKTHMKLTKAG